MLSSLLTHLFIPGNQSRPRIFDLSITKPDVLQQSVIEVDERYVYNCVGILFTDTWDDSVVLINSDAAMDRVENPEQVPGAVEGVSGEWIQVLRKPGISFNWFKWIHLLNLAIDLQAVKKDLQALYDTGLRSIAVCLMHSYTFPGTFIHVLQ